DGGEARLVPPLLRTREGARARRRLPEVGPRGEACRGGERQAEAARGLYAAPESAVPRDEGRRPARAQARRPRPPRLPDGRDLGGGGCPYPRGAPVSGARTRVPWRRDAPRRGRDRADGHRGGNRAGITPPALLRRRGLRRVGLHGAADGRLPPPPGLRRFVGRVGP